MQVRSLAFRDGVLVLELVATGPGEPACCPTLKVRRTYRLESGSLVEAASDPPGPVSIRDLQGATWALTHLARQEPVPEGVRITARFNDGRVSGSAGCNGYFGGISGNGPSTLHVGPVGKTKMARPEALMEAEGRYLRRLEGVTAFRFVLGRLALTYQDGDIQDALRFAPSR